MLFLEIPFIPQKNLESNLEFVMVSGMPIGTHACRSFSRIFLDALHGERQRSMEQLPEAPNPVPEPSPEDTGGLALFLWRLLL